MTVGSIKCWFNEAVPEPTDKSRSVQLGVHIEEFAEMWDAIKYDEHVANVMHQWGNYFKEHVIQELSNADRKELLDSLCDQIVTAIGVAHMFNFDIIGALAEVNESNWSKFIDGKAVFDENGKIKKGPNYFKPDLSKFV